LSERSLQPQQIKLDISGPLTVFKVSERVFQIDEINNVNKDFINKIVNLLDYGYKFVPCWHTSMPDVFFAILKNLDTNFANFNKRLFFTKKKNFKFLQSNEFDLENYFEESENKVNLQGCE
jgi:hypothetical protein